MAKKDREVKVHPEFDKSLDETFQYLKQDSPQFATKFKDELIEQMERIIQHPLAYPKEEAIPGKKGIYRYSVFKKSWKIIYKVLDSSLIFLKLFHVKQNPKRIHEVKKYK
jgi:plasmid stabilization system protein ParE